LIFGIFKKLDCNVLTPTCVPEHAVLRAVAEQRLDPRADGLADRMAVNVRRTVASGRAEREAPLQMVL